MLLNLTETKDKEILQAILSTIDEGIHAVDANGVSIFYNHVAAKLDGLEGKIYSASTCWMYFRL